MVTKYNSVMGSWWIFTLLTILNTIRHGGLEGLRTFDAHNLGHKPKGTIKTIEVPGGADVIDCVDIYKQPAFDNPLIKELKMVPKSITSELNKVRYRQPKYNQTWNKYGTCPQGTIPMRRTWNNVTTYRKGNDDPNTREYATVLHRANKIHGAKAIFNVWKPRVVSLNEFSLSQLWVVAGPIGERNTVEAGWMVYPRLFHDLLPRLFIFWTNDNYERHGCYNHLCPAFVQTSYDIALGSAWDVPSVYNGDQTAETIGFIRSKDIEGGDWWLQVGEYILGYYPRTLFPNHLGDGADYIEFGGEIVNSQPRRRHTATTMGSGRFSAEGFRKACFISNIRIKNEELTWVDGQLQVSTISRPTCYDLGIGPSRTEYGSHFYFGGPGYSPQCL